MRKELKEHRPCISLNVTCDLIDGTHEAIFNKYYLDESYGVDTLVKAVAFIKENRDRIFKPHSFDDLGLIEKMRDLDITMPSCIDTLCSIEFVYERGVRGISIPLELEGVCLEECRNE